MVNRLNNLRNKDFFLTPVEAAKVIHVSLSTLKKFIYSGKLKTLKTPGGHHRILKSHLYAMLSEK
jgi:excisionase family DNA binding protein